LSVKRSILATALTVLTTATFALAPLALAGDAPASAPTPRPAPPPPAAKAAAAGPEHVQVQHVLIGFKGSVPGKNITRTPEEAKVLAAEVLARAKKGEDFGALVKQYTDDAPPGIYGMSNTGIPPAQGERSRSGMVPGFGDASFVLKVGEIGMAEYDPQKSPYGWHIVKRLK